MPFCCRFVFIPFPFSDASCGCEIESPPNLVPRLFSESQTLFFFLYHFDPTLPTLFPHEVLSVFSHGVFTSPKSSHTAPEASPTICSSPVLSHDRTPLPYAHVRIVFLSLPSAARTFAARTRVGDPPPPDQNFNPRSVLLLFSTGSLPHSRGAGDPPFSPVCPLPALLKGP